MFWAKQEAEKILKRFKNEEEILLEIGYSLSLIHI